MKRRVRDSTDKPQKGSDRVMVDLERRLTEFPQALGVTARISTLNMNTSAVARRRAAAATA